MAHFFYIHGSLPTYFKNIFEGHVATQYMNGEGRPDLGGTEGAQMLGTTSVASYYGPSFMIDDLTYHYEHGDANRYSSIATIRSTRIPLCCNTASSSRNRTRCPATRPCRPRSLSATTSSSVSSRTSQIWRHKARIDNPLLVEEDGPVYQLRRWYQQFYVDVADVQPDMVDRFEFELDTTRPYEAWMKEVEANMAARAATAGSVR